ncbi:MAG: amidohydrolase family protein [Lachnospiraceae bacterium]|nr:amidohydrolase family protein [Lachnospiraceae bacterium]
MGRIKITNARIWDGENFHQGDIFVDNGIIQAMKETGTAWESAEIAEKAAHPEFCYDARGKIVTAGLVDIHTHMLGISSDQYGIHAEMSCLPFGVTAAADAGATKGGKALMDTFLVKALAFVSMSIKNNHAELEKAEALLSLFGDRAVGVKVYFDIYVSEVRDITPLKEICDYAHARNLIVMVHSSNSPVPMSQVLETLGKGDIFSHAYHGGMNNVADDDFRALEQAKERGVIIDAGMAGYVHTDFGILKAAIEAGALPDVISTDITRCSAYIRGGIYGMTMCMSIMRRLGMKEEDIFRAVTSNPAKALGKDKEWGYLKAGRCADIAVFDYAKECYNLTDQAGNNVNGTEGYLCVLTISDGQVVYRREGTD